MRPDDCCRDTAYRQKARNLASSKGRVVAAEWDLAGIPDAGGEAAKQTVIASFLLDGQDRIHSLHCCAGESMPISANSESYFDVALELLLRPLRNRAHGASCYGTIDIR